MHTPDLHSTSGQALAFVAISIVALLGIAGLAVDLGSWYRTKTQLQGSADATALAAAQELPNAFAVNTVAHEYAELNEGSGSPVLDDADIQVGNWERTTRVFTPAGLPSNAVYIRIRLERSAARANPAPTFFAKVFGIYEVDIDAIAIATSMGGGAGTRFIVDSEMIDSDIPVIEDLADQLGIDSEDLISDLDGDWFIDLPPYQILELPTGQVGDEGLFDIQHPEFPFGYGTDPSFADFLNYNEDSSSWRYDLIPKEMMDPLTCPQKRYHLEC